MWLALVVFTSGIVDEGPPLVVVVPQYCPPLVFGPGWAWNLVRSLVGSGLAHCWVLKDQVPPGWGECESSGLLGRRRTVRVCGWFLVGLLFEICIVDASILYRCRRRA